MVDRNQAYGDMDRFDQKLKSANPLADESSEDEGQQKTPVIMGEVDVLQEKNRILMERLYKA
jgi:hypothetical protein